LPRAEDRENRFDALVQSEHFAAFAHSPRSIGAGFRAGKKNANLRRPAGKKQKGGARLLAEPSPKPAPQEGPNGGGHPRRSNFL
jgi:hypothetical protein